MVKMGRAQVLGERRRGIGRYILYRSNLRRLDMVRTLEKHGDRCLIEIDQSILERLKLEPGAAVEVATDGERIIVHAANGFREDESLKDALRKVNEGYGDVLRNLAK
jgi:antitoxin component of MazEF toxin-antitoxin module